jgi:hypothetical protein
MQLKIQDIFQLVFEMRWSSGNLWEMTKTSFTMEVLRKLETAAICSAEMHNVGII